MMTCLGDGGLMKPIAFAVAGILCGIGCSTPGRAASNNWPSTLTLGTASPGGVYYVYGDAIAQVLTQKLGIPVNALPTQGPVHNVKLVETGGAQLGMITMGVGLQGWNGTGDWTGGKPMQKMRALFPLYDTPFQAVVLRKSGITSLAQLNKKRFGIGPRAGTGGTYIPSILKVLGISADSAYGSFADMIVQLFAGRHDAFVTLTGAPMPAIKEAELKEPITLISSSPEQIDAVRKALPEFSPSTIAAGTYRSLDKDYRTFGVYNFAVGRADIPDDLAYQLVKAVFEGQPEFLKDHPSASETIPQNVDKNTFLPFHPGAVRYYREIGINVPDFRVPTN
jgi:uncharacterized protein